MLALEIEFERALHLHNEDYEASDDYDLPQPLHKFTHIYAVSSSTETFFNPMGCQGSPIPIFLSTPKGRPVGLIDLIDLISLTFQKKASSRITYSHLGCELNSNGTSYEV